jgi:ribosomal-protein-alanine N-acetyltransferase
MNAPEQLKTTRLLLRRPRLADAELIFSRYASDLEVTKFLGWPRHVSIEQTRAFLAYSELEWERWPAGPYLIEDLKDGRLLGSTGFAFENPQCAMTGYVLAKDAWGFGFATEALNAIVRVAENLHIAELFALCHPGHRASYHVLEKCGFIRQPELLLGAHFPNLSSDSQAGALRYVRRFHEP